MIRSLLVLLGTLAAPVVLAAVPASPATAVAVYDVRGGDAFSVASSGGRCAIGFSVRGGYITSGKCGSVGQTTVGYNGVVQGVIQASSFPGASGAWVRTNTNWRPRGLVNRYDGTNMVVHGATVAPVGSVVCMAGPVGGWRCGIITARNVTVNFPEGILTGLIRTNICAFPGELGAPLIANGQAQGILVGASGSSGNCASYFVPVAKILSSYGLTLVTE